MWGFSYLSLLKPNHITKWAPDNWNWSLHTYSRALFARRLFHNQLILHYPFCMKSVLGRENKSNNKSSIWGLCIFYVFKNGIPSQPQEVVIYRCQWLPFRKPLWVAFCVYVCTSDILRVISLETRTFTRSYLHIHKYQLILLYEWM